ncbi:MAG: 30S ribosome-binding factor RbfA [Firmicutes bacterium]|nr:30S ribosome-binding factor RbfA [Clostridiales bacterium]MBQ4340256.1 30S ribosome-binding factor RbfA [Bacillota bacterium]
MQKNYRSGRLGEEIRKIISTMMMRGDLKDPDISPITSVTAVDVTSDGSYATVYLSIMGTEEEKKATLAALKRAAGFIRNNIGKAVKIRHVPELTFKIDTTLEYGMHISKLIDDLNKDAKKSGDDVNEE